MARLANLPARLDDAILAKVEEYARSTPPALARTDRDHILQFIKLMSDMPRKDADQDTGEVKKENIVFHLERLPRACLNWMRGEVHIRFTFFPSIKELLDLAKEWRRNDDAVLARSKAAVMVRRERETRMDEARYALRHGRMLQEEIDALPERWKQIFEAESLLRLHDDGGYTLRRRDEPEASDENLEQIQERMKAAFPTSRDEAA